MIENLNESVERGGKIELSLERSDSLVETSRTYKKSSRKVKTTMRNRRYKMIALLIFICIVSLQVRLF